MMTPTIEDLRAIIQPFHDRIMAEAKASRLELQCAAQQSRIQRLEAENNVLRERVEDMASVLQEVRGVLAAMSKQQGFEIVTLLQTARTELRG